MADKDLFNGKKAQMHLPLEMMFSILLIAVFLVVAFFVTRHFLEVQKCAQIGLFVRDLQEKVDETWNAQEASTSFEAELPSSIKYVCLANLSEGKSLAGLDAGEKEIASTIYDELRILRFKNANLFFYPIESACSMPANYINHIDLEGLNNPYCFHLSKFRIKLVKGFDENLVKLIPAMQIKSELVDLSTSTKQSLEISEGEKTTLKTEKKYGLKLGEVSSDSAEILLGSSSLKLKINETAMADTNRNGAADLAITLKSIQDNTAAFSFEKIKEDECSICIAKCTKDFDILVRIPIVRILVIKWFVPPASVCSKRCEDSGLCRKIEPVEIPVQPNQTAQKTGTCNGKKIRCCNKVAYKLHGVIDPPPSMGLLPYASTCIESYWTECSAAPFCNSIPLVTYPLVWQPVIVNSGSCTYSC